MIQRISTLIGLSILCVALAFPQAQPQKPAALPQHVRNRRPVLSVPKDYYNARGRRDPFVNPVPKPVQKAAPVELVIVPPPGLRGVL